MKPLSHDTLRGNWATLLLATDKQGKIDFSRQSDEIDILIASKPNGIYSNGTAGEFYSQNRDEFVRISQLLAEKCEAAGTAFQIGASHPCAQESLARLELVRDLKPGAIQVILPDWFPVNDREAIRFLTTMAEKADGIPLVLYNPPHAKRELTPAEWAMLKRHVPGLIGVKTNDKNSSPKWYEQVASHTTGLAVFVPGHHLATGVRLGAAGAYSNVACLNPFAAQRWYELTLTDMAAALELEGRIQQFMERWHHAVHRPDEIPQPRLRPLHGSRRRMGQRRQHTAVALRLDSRLPYRRGSAAGPANHSRISQPIKIP